MSASGASTGASKHKTPEKATELTGDFYKKAEEESKPQSTEHIATQSDSQAIYVRQRTSTLLLPRHTLDIVSWRRRRRNTRLTMQQTWPYC